MHTTACSQPPLNEIREGDGAKLLLDILLNPSPSQPRF